MDINQTKEPNDQKDNPLNDFARLQEVNPVDGSDFTKPKTITKTWGIDQEEHKFA